MKPRLLPFLLVAVTTGSVFYTPISLKAQNALPQKSQELLNKLEVYEIEKRKNLEKELKDKRKAVSDALQQHLREEKVESPVALALQSVLDHLASAPLGKSFEANSIKVLTNPRSTLNTQQLFEELLKRTYVESRNLQQKDRDQLKTYFAAEIAGFSEPITEVKPGGIIIELNQEGVVSKRVFSNVQGSDKKKVAEVRDEFTTYLRKTDKENIVILAIAGAFTPINMSEKADKIFEIIGGKTGKVAWQQPYICIGYNGMRRGGATESLGEVDGDFAKVKPKKD